MNFTRAQLPDVIRKAYELSKPQGMGHLHYRPGTVDKRVLEDILRHSDKSGVVYMDYVQGRAVKLHITRGADGLWHIDADRWFDHSEYEWDTLCNFIKDLNNDTVA